jgi:hypothetical protein
MIEQTVTTTEAVGFETGLIDGEVVELADREPTAPSGLEAIRGDAAGAEPQHETAAAGVPHLNELRRPGELVDKAFGEESHHFLHP